MGMIAELLCKIGIHLKKGHVCNFTDCISGKLVYDATCACGRYTFFTHIFLCRKVKEESIMETKIPILNKTIIIKRKKSIEQRVKDAANEPVCYEPAHIIIMPGGELDSPVYTK